MSKFKVGDIVRLKSGSPKMTVSCITLQRVCTTWYDAEIRRGIFTLDELELYVSPAKGPPVLPTPMRIISPRCE